MVVASGSLSTWLDQLRTIVAASSTFQTVTGAADATAALESIHIQLTIDEARLYAKRPFALIAVVERSADPAADGVGTQTTVRGGLVLTLEDNAKHGNNEEASTFEFLNFAGGVIDDIEEIAGVDAYLATWRNDMSVPPNRTPRAERNPDRDFWTCSYRIHAGDYEGGE